MARDSHTRLLAALVTTVLLVASCASGGDGASPSSAADREVTVEGSRVNGDVEPAEVVGDEVVVVVDATDPGKPIDRRILGTNVPAWLGPAVLADRRLHDAVREVGTTLLRMPGGSWSNSYDWSACEIGDDTTCYWTWAARPSDFVDLLQATGLPGMWTVSINATAESAAAAVAFFNGNVDDTSEIGVDRQGVDWGTVSRWAQLRVDGGNPDPIDIELWEVGNEVYGGRPGAGGDDCAPFGWEDVWTCDGSEYVLGDDLHDGYLSIRSAMLDVDSSIEVGAVGVADPGSWGNWGNEVISATGSEMDFYVVHQYGFDESPMPDEALTRAGEVWPAVVAGVRSELDETVPIAITEYNLVAVEAADTDRSMTRAVNALFVADTIGQFATLGVPIANHWNLANGTTSSGTDYGMVSTEDGSRFPQFDAMELFSRMGSALLPSESSDDVIRPYVTRHEEGAMTVIVINLGPDRTNAVFEFDGSDRIVEARAETSAARTIDATEMERSEQQLEVVPDSQQLSVILEPWSITAVEVTVGR